MEIKTITNQYGMTVDLFPDTAEGAKAALMSMAIYKDKDLGGVIADPWVEGVWKVMHTAKATKKYGTTASIVYLAGYKNPWGEIRQDNDFEDVE